MRRNVIVIPKAANLTHQADNIAAFTTCKVTDADSAKIDAISASKQYRLNGSLCSPSPLSNACWEGLALGMKRDDDD
jgi:diketogulonate reductase-like aldo/keto reductase